MSDLKVKLYKACKQHVANSIVEIEAAIADRREAIHNETKSSMGDKYETTREMLQQDINMNLNRLAKAKTELAVLNNVQPDHTSAIIIPGSLVYTDSGSFYISISAGSIIIEGQKYYAVSAASPIGVQLKGKRQGDDYTLNGKQVAITSVE